jgi:predicted DNA-binding protein
MEVISFRIPKELKKRLKEVKLNWSEEVRNFIEERVREYKREKALKEIDDLLKDLLSPEKGTASSYVREDRDSH